MSRYENCVFDLYGTLIDIRTDENDSVFLQKTVDYLKRKGIEYEPEDFHDDFFMIVNRQMAESRFDYPEADVLKVFAEMTDGKLNERELLDFAWFFRQSSTKLLKLYDGVIDMLEMLRKEGKRIILLTNAQSSFTVPELDMFDLAGYFDDIFISSDYGVRKPSESFWNIMLRKTGIDPHKSVMIGNDYFADLSTAGKLGLDTIYIHQEISPELSDFECTYKILDGNVRKLAEYLH